VDGYFTLKAKHRTRHGGMKGQTRKKAQGTRALQSPPHLLIPSPAFLINILFPSVRQIQTEDFQASTPVPSHPSPHCTRVFVSHQI